MSEVMANQVSQALKGYFRNEEFSDKVLHIIEMEGATKSTTNAKETTNEDGEEIQVEISSYEELGKSKETTQTVLDDDEDPKKVFHGCSFFISKNISGDDIEKVKKLIEENGGHFINCLKTAIYVISHYLLPRKKQAANARERTIQWLEDCITKNEIEPSIVNVLHRPISITSKPLKNLILTFGNCEENEKNQLKQIAKRLGASYQDLIFSRQYNNRMIASTHFILCSENKSDIMQFNTASDWSIPCVSKQWLWECSERLRKVDVKKYVIATMSVTDVNFITESEYEINNAYSVIPVHSLLLSINSKYFKALTSSDFGMQEKYYKNIVVKVNPGEGRYLELLIHSIYDQDVLKELDIIELLTVLELADRFLCDLLIEYGLKILKNFNFKTVEQCSEVLEQIQIFKSLSSVSLNEAYKYMKELCGNVLADCFHSLECYPEKLDDFLMLSLNSLLALLKSDKSCFWHENNVVYFVISWLATDEGRQLEYNIEKLLKRVRYEYMSLGFFIDILSIDHDILSQWQGFSKWYANALLYHGLSTNDRTIRGLNASYNHRSLQNSNTEAQSFILKLENSEYYDEKIFQYETTAHQKVVYQGYEVTPMIFITHNDNDTYNIFLVIYFGDANDGIEEIENLYLTFNIAFGIFPGKIVHNPQSMVKDCRNNYFIKHHFRRCEVEFRLKNYFEKHIGTVDVGLFEKFKAEGLNLSITFGGSASELYEWPKSLLALSDVKCYEIHRKSTTNFGLNDLYQNIWMHAKKIPEGKYF